jgi:hypothetical protein
MNIEKIRELVNSDSPSSRVAELAALFLMRSVTVEPVDSMDIDHVRDYTLYPKAEFGLRPELAARIAEALVQVGETLQALAVIDCNQGLSPAQERNVERNRERAKAIGEALGFRVETGGDPRGCVLKLYDPKDERLGDNWGGGWGVYRG